MLGIYTYIQMGIPETHVAERSFLQNPEDQHERYTKENSMRLANNKCPALVVELINPIEPCPPNLTL